MIRHCFKHMFPVLHRPVFAVAAAGLIVLPGALPAKTRDGARVRRFYVRLGPGRIVFNEKTRIQVGGQPLPGARSTVSSNTGVSFDIGYFIRPNLSVAATLGIPLTTTLTAAGTFSGAGTLGKVKYGPGLYSVRYHFDGLGRVRPYIGGGLSWTIVFDTKDGVLRDFRSSDAIGPAITAGVDVPLGERLGVYLAGSKVWSSTNSHFRLATPNGLVPGTARVQLDPFVTQIGVQYRF